MGLLIHLLCLLVSAGAILCGSVSLTRSGQDAVLGSEFSFNCTADADRVVGLISFKRVEAQSSRAVCSVAVDTGRQITGSETALCSAVAGQTHTYSLTIRKVSLNDSTVWMCQGAGMKSNNVTLDVRYPPTVAIHAVAPCSGLTFLVNESNVALSCSVKEANPAPTNFTWYHGDVPLQTGPSPVYNLSPVTRSSQGRYRCTADNGISPPGQARETVVVHYPPNVRVDATKRVARETEDLTITCTAEANPEVTSVVWTKKGVGARKSDSGTLHLRNIQKTDAGVYICTATNNVKSCSGTRQTKSSSASVTLEVQSKPQEPTNLKAVNIQPRSVTLTWEKSSNGGAKQRFNIQYRQPGGQWTTHPTSPTEDDILRLDIDGLEPGTVYEFRINARNEYGKSSYAPNVVTTTKANSSGVPVYVVVIACVTTALLGAALYKAVVVGWAKRKSSTQAVAVATTAAAAHYETTTRDMNVGESAYDSLAPVEAQYVNTNANNQPRPSTCSTSSASRDSQSLNAYYSTVADSNV